MTSSAVPRLTGKVAIVTGGSDGIGKATALTFAREGAKVVIVGRNEAKGRRALRELKEVGEATYFKVDVSDSQQVKRMVEDTIQRYGRVDILINNAAICPPGDVVTTTEAIWDEVIDINLKGVFLCSKYAIPHMQKNGGGAIVNIGSINSLMAMENEAAYDASKGGVLMLTKAMALDFARSRVRVNCICPGAIETPMLKASLDTAKDPKAARVSLIQKHPLRRAGTPEEIAQAALFLATDDSSFITGATIPVDGGILAGWT
jgi:NAD(P)-dependent dehydrogenase (short-subunit alcohol dehydrogenase family)